MFLTVALERLMARATPRTSPEISVRSAASMATSVPVPMATPTSACASAGASLMPSPTMATFSPSLCSRFTSAALSCGSTSARTRSMPSSRAMASAVRRLSPVSMATSRPISCSQSTASLDSWRTTSATASGLAVHGDEDRGLALQRELLAPRDNAVLGHARLGEETAAAHEAGVTLHPSPHTPAARGAEPLGLGEGEIPLLRAPHDGLAKRVLAGPFG